MTCTVEITLHALSQRSPARSGIENSWPKGKAKVKNRSSYKQHTLSQRSPTEWIGKGQKLIEAARPKPTVTGEGKGKGKKFIEAARPEGRI